MNPRKPVLLGAGWMMMAWLALAPQALAAPPGGGGGNPDSVRVERTAAESRAPKTPMAMPVPADRGGKARAGETGRRTTWGTGVWGGGHAGLALPTAFRPGAGETYTIPGLEQTPDNRLFVFDARGRRVYVQRGYSNGWDGTDREGKPLPAGTYFLMLEIGGLGDDVQAYVQLLR
jgi:gliding motility-associated-like protein